MSKNQNIKEKLPIVFDGAGLFEIVEDACFRNMQVFIKYLLGSRGGYPNPDSTHTLYPHVRERLEKITFAPKYESLSDKDKQSFRRQAKLIIEDTLNYMFHTDERSTDVKEISEADNKRDSELHQRETV